VQPTQVEQLLDMAAVHAFYIGLLEDVLGHPVPTPRDITASPAEAVEKSIHDLQHWLNLLDLAITPPMVRDALRESTTQETAEALLRHFVRKSSRSDPDRDKTDFIVTFLYRSLVPADKQIPIEVNVEEPSEFEEEIYTIIASEESAALPEEHRQLVREFPFIRQEVDDYGHFDQLMDSGVIQRVREIKQRFGDSFYHPRVLSTIAAYNVYFGSRFDHLFKQTTQQIKKFASKVQQQGGSIMSRVDGDVTVQHLAAVEEQQTAILQTEYGRAQEQFRKISKLKKAVDSRTGAHPHASSAAAAAHAPVPGVPAGRGAHAPGVGESVPAGINPAVEQGKLRSMEDSIRNFIVAADPKSAHVVPLRNGNTILSNVEVEAFRADYGADRSFRADYAGALRQSVAIQLRIQSELQEFSNKQSSAYLWKPHADALAFLIAAAQKLQEQCGSVLAVAERRGLADKVTAIANSLQKMRQQVQLAAKALQGDGN
jgi:hypothetical protein